MKRKMLSILLCFALVIAAVLPMGTVLAQGTAPKSVPVITPQGDGLMIGSSVEQNDDGSYHIRLDSYVTSAHKPLDVVLVLDTSNNMDEGFGNTTRLQAMKEAAEQFIHTLRDSYTDTYHHHVGIVSYSDTATKVTPTLTELRNDTVETELCNKIEALGVDNDRYRHIDEAMTVANELMNGDYDDNHEHPKEHQKVVIVLSSGTPKDSSYDFSSGMASKAIATSYQMKQQGALVYSIGMFNEANPDELYGASGFHCNSDGAVESHWDDGDITAPFQRDIPANNRFFNYLSSNSFEAKNLGLVAETYLAHDWDLWTAYGWKITANYTCDTNAGYYKSAKDPDALNQVFEDIVNKTLESHVQLDTSAVLKETISPYFEITGDVTCSTVASTGDLKFDEENKVQVELTVSKQNNIVSVRGFDYNTNCVTPTAKSDQTYGKKLVVEFDVKRKADMIGGNQIPICGGGESGMYQSGSTNVGTLLEEKVDLPIEYNYTTSNQTIFLGETADLANRINTPAYVDGTNNAFVDISYTIKNGDQTVGTYTISAGQSSGSWVWADGQTGMPALTEDTVYTVDCAVTPNPTGTIPATAIVEDFTVFVQSGTLTIQKQGGQDDEKYVFNIEKDGKYYMTVTVDGNSGTTIQKLPKGKYNVTEETAWSWRYGEQSYDQPTVTIDLSNLAQTVICTNSERNPKWLNGYNACVNAYAEGGAQ
ncbi:VWA domain-containing protein [Phocea massiliensis]|uniref:VWA domain-containing protein n=1 Tax=Merdimmobilis hominis TaxID=2897707 RepID=A0A938X6U3_9FIRM|nr:vWA domain-containing protein [Merdimmobilis hominis]MBM6921256.1 VWA domain-containing protein [Merdimmobilis hominis]